VEPWACRFVDGIATTIALQIYAVRSVLRACCVAMSGCSPAARKVVAVGRASARNAV